MTKIDIFSGFLGAGKTTLIKKLIAEAYKGEKLVLIENEFGEIGIDGGFLKEAGIEITEMNSGCICCSLVGDFGKALEKVLDEFSPDRILIEPSGVGKLSDVIRAVGGVLEKGAELNSFTTVVDASKCKVYMKNFGEFFGDQIKNAGTIILSRTANISDEKLNACLEIIKEQNETATVVTTPWESLSGAQILMAMEKKDTLAAELKRLEHEAHDECDDEECSCHHHHHDHDDDEHEHHHHHHHHDEEECDDENCSCHHHHHDDDDDEHEHEHHHHHHHHHHADEIFTSWGTETAKKFTVDGIKAALSELGNSEKYGVVLRAKGLVAGEDGNWIYFDFVPEETNIRFGAPDVTGRLCVIGSGLKEEAVEELFK